MKGLLCFAVPPCSGILPKIKGLIDLNPSSVIKEVKREVFLAASDFNRLIYKFGHLEHLCYSG